MKIFLNYRRNDNPHATDRLVERLVSEFGRENVFYDVSSIPIGVNWRSSITDVLSKTDVFIAAIGDNWLKALRRRKGKTDMVRSEIETALKRGVPIIPVQIGRTEFPQREALPSEIADLFDWNGIQLRSGVDYQTDVRRLIDRLKELDGALRSLDLSRTESGASGPARPETTQPLLDRSEPLYEYEFLEFRQLGDIIICTLITNELTNEETIEIFFNGLTALLNRGYLKVVVNFQHVGFISSSALSCLLRCYRRARLAGGDFRICCLDEKAREVFRITRFDRVLKIDDTVELSIQEF